MKRVAVLMGGWSAEREVSLVSGAACADGLREAGYDVHDDRRRPRPRRRCCARSSRAPDVVFNALHGRYGEDGCDPGPARAAGHPLHPFRRAGLGARHGQADGQARLRRAPACRCPEGKVVEPSTRLADGDPMPRPYVVKPIDRGLQRRRAHRARRRQPAAARPRRTGRSATQVLVERYRPRPRADRRRDGRPRRWRSPSSARSTASTTTRPSTPTATPSI